MGRWSVRGATAALGVASVVLAIGWVTPWPEAELQPWAGRMALPLLFLALGVAVWPSKTIRRTSDLDRRLSSGDRLATAWIHRDSTSPIARLQRSDAIAHLGASSPRTAIRWRPARLEMVALAGSLCIAAVLVLAPSPQQAVLDKRALEQAQVEQATQRLDALRQEAAVAPSLSPEQSRQLDELLQQARAELSHVHTQREAADILARSAEQMNQQLADPNADLRDEALAAMSETLATEPLAQGLADALQHEDAAAAHDAVQSLAAEADRLSDVQRQALSRALQRAANVGRADPRSSSALRDASRAVAAGESSHNALSAADAAVRDAIQASTSQASLRATTRHVRDLQAQLAAGSPLSPDARQPGTTDAQAGQGPGATLSTGTPVAVDAGGGAQAAGLLNDPSTTRGSAGGSGANNNLAQGQANTAAPAAAENVFVPGRVGNGSADSLDLTDQPFTVRGGPRPYGDVLGEYAQTGRDYVDRPEVSPAVRNLVKQYFQQLEEGR